MVRESIIILNLIVVLSSLYPCIYFIGIFLRERKLIDTKKRSLNSLLNLLGFGFIFGTILSGLTSFFSIIGFNNWGHNISPYTRLTLSLYGAFAMWALYFYRQKRVK